MVFRSAASPKNLILNLEPEWPVHLRSRRVNVVIEYLMSPLLRYRQVQRSVQWQKQRQFSPLRSGGLPRDRSNKEQYQSLEISDWRLS
jgi:hypothetical protein